jgi:Uma2 family endonuclease
VDEEVLLITNPPGIGPRRIVRAIADDAKRAFYTGAATVNWATDENFQWDLPDGSGRFYIPDITFIHPDATTAEEERAAIALVVEVTSPASPDTVLNDRTTKPGGWDRYQVAADGDYGEEISLPLPLNFSVITTTWPRWK